MNRTLLLMRHAKAEDGFGMADVDRPLSDKGHRQAERVGRLLSEEGYAPDHVICSSAERTRRTLEGVLTAMDLNPGVDHTEAAYLAGPDSLLDLITYVDPGVRTLLVVGHNPTIAQVAASFVGDQALAAFSPATVAAVDLEVEWLYTAPGMGSGRVLN
ncbi:histidine phosphatase family protein [Nocardiopsis sp. MG754419]|uniref:SixA phosphatase family protein n=1 Tax=Nocardiopsis sp. MG754419 TaxID=2259865 RepID=UPI001BAE17CE|nr:histidine phosphatase family protein [Nocardiopsis sp. MG754419]MBR8742009.1 histidine phosphatase family protein [Nocardiopsis sp. MG754419]